MKGPRRSGAGPRFRLVAAVVVAGAIGYPQVVDSYTVGMSAMPNLTIPWPGDDPLVLAPDLPLYCVVLGLVVVVYLGLRMLVNSSFGNVVVAIRENPERATMLGYDVRRYQLATFVIGSALAGLSGVLYTTWGQ